MRTVQQITVHVLTGFLGSGKTTLLQRMLKSPSFSDTAVLVNELGEIGLDHHLIERVDEGVVLLQSGCVCCTVRSDLRDSLRDLYARRGKGRVPPFGRLVLETTGLADPTPIISTLLSEPMIRNHFRLGNVICTVDAVNASEQLGRQPESVKQIAVADRLVLTKVDLVESMTIRNLAQMIARLNPTTPLSPSSDLDPESLVIENFHDVPHGIAESGSRVEAANHIALPSAQDQPEPPQNGQGRYRHDSRICAFALTFDEPMDWSAFGVWLSMLLAARGDDILRVKGILNIAGSSTPLAIHGVQRVVHPPVHLTAWPDDDRRSRLVFIVRAIDRGVIERSLTAFLKLGA